MHPTSKPVRFRAGASAYHEHRNDTHGARKCCISNEFSAAPASGGALPRGSEPYGAATEWQLVPRAIPAMEETPVRFARVRRAEGVGADDGFLHGRGDLVVPAHSKASVLVDQGGDAGGAFESPATRRNGPSPTRIARILTHGQTRSHA